MAMDSMFTSLIISSSGLSAQRKKLDAIASNIANANTTRTESGEPYRRKIAVMQANSLPAFEKVLQQAKLRLINTNPEHIPLKKSILLISNRFEAVQTKVREDSGDFKRVYDPDHPDADENGFVYYPNINVISEMVEMISASRAYEANLSAIQTAKRMANEALNI